MYKNISLMEVEKILADSNIDRELLNRLAIERFASECWEKKICGMSKPALIEYINQQIESERTLNIIAEIAKR